MVEQLVNKEVHENGISYPSDNIMLDLRDLKKVYPTPNGDYVVLEHLNLQILKEEFVTIIGHSGCGKTTMLSMIAGQYQVVILPYWAILLKVQVQIEV